MARTSKSMVVIEFRAAYEGAHNRDWTPFKITNADWVDANRMCELMHGGTYEFRAKELPIMPKADVLQQIADDEFRLAIKAA